MPVCIVRNRGRRGPGSRGKAVKKSMPWPELGCSFVRDTMVAGFGRRKVALQVLGFLGWSGLSRNHATPSFVGVCWRVVGHVSETHWPGRRRCGWNAPL